MPNSPLIIEVVILFMSTVVSPSQHEAPTIPPVLVRDSRLTKPQFPLGDERTQNKPKIGTLGQSDLARTANGSSSYFWNGQSSDHWASTSKSVENDRSNWDRSSGAFRKERRRRHTPFLPGDYWNGQRPDFGPTETDVRVLVNGTAQLKCPISHVADDRVSYQFTCA